MKYHVLSRPPSPTVPFAFSHCCCCCCCCCSLLSLRRLDAERTRSPPLLGNRPRSVEEEGRGNMADSVGTLKVLVVRGKRLVIRDFRSSDPYVVARLGNQTLKTKVINRCLNPVWNEELTFSVTGPVGILRLEVFDRDRFKADDKMGHTHLNLQPIASASRLRRALRLSSGETNLRKVAPGTDNCLLEESFITYVDGEIVQHVRLRLCDVESGELELKLRWIDNPRDAREAARGD